MVRYSIVDIKNGQMAATSIEERSLPTQLQRTMDTSAERGDGNSLPHGMDEAVIEVPRNKLLRVVLVSPQG
ncbi:hypothetical protein GH714_015870 [Hevea brasiliensis]|uniref:Uncharacterized protein n=1 Tax=Hevea brasiliensis TaxID=3981 RepID=A0A6A6N4N2_HEVBR|nr:hypothetical protein GH714_015870 [Hevea brasiliensis]